jgi:uncharacterized membrane protein YeaQ/YmgE (transglycosylase-associated protein family)
MKTTSQFIPMFRYLSICGLFVFHLNLVLVPTAVCAAEEPGVVDKAKAVVQDTKEKASDATTAVTEATKEAKDSVVNAGRTVGGKFAQLWSRLDENRLKNRSRDEIVAWVLMGVLIGAGAGLFTSFKSSGAGKVGRLLVGLAGALIGGMVVRVAQLDFGWGPVLIRYEELLFSLLGAVLLIVLVRFIGARTVKKTPKA